MSIRGNNYDKVYLNYILGILDFIKNKYLVMQKLKWYVNFGKISKTIVILLATFVLVIVQQTSIVYSTEHPPWCPIRESSVRYFIWPDLDQYATEKGYHNLLNTQVIEDTAMAWNNGRKVYEGRWPC